MLLLDRDDSPVDRIHVNRDYLAEALLILCGAEAIIRPERKHMTALRQFAEQEYFKRVCAPRMERR